MRPGGMSRTLTSYFMPGSKPGIVVGLHQPPLSAPVEQDESQDCLTGLHM